MRKVFFITVALVVAIALLAGGYWYVASQSANGLPGVPSKREDRYSQSAFQQWLEGDPARQRDYAAFTAFLAREGVGDAVPAWQLLRTEPHIRPQCERPPFLVPPQEDWPRIVPVLRVVRDEIEPLVGEVEVKSAYRSPSLNACIKGASRSRHLSFAAVDLVAPDQPDNETLFRKLCAFHRAKGQRLAIGLGAYFDPAEAAKNRYGRFHIDTSGYRSWGYSFGSGSSGCRYLD